MKFEQIPPKYRPVPFWSWNEKLSTEETARQVKMMADAGIGGYFMHARGGLQTTYMSGEWFDNVKAALETGKECNMYSWAYDENGWPSGWGNGVVNGLGEAYQQKFLRMGDVEPEHNSICKCGKYWFWYEVNPYYVDVLDKKVAEKFIEVAYEPYYDRFGTDFQGFFTDEPQISRNGIPWSAVFENEYRMRYEEDILSHLDELFLPVGEYKETRVKFWRMVTELFSENFIRPLYEWCEKRGLKLTGHMLCEESLLSQLTTNGACMPCYEYFHIPGMDWLGRDIRDCLTPMQVSSVCEQLGKKQVISETFAMCGHNVSLAELKGIYEWQMVHGINLLCPHLEGYSIRGMRKRDYPPAMYYQQPWWKEYHRFSDAMARIGMILSEGKKKVEVLVLHPMTTAWSLYDNGKNEGLDELNNRLLDIMKTLEKKHIGYHLGDELIMKRHGSIKNGKLVIGEQEYDKIIDPGCDILLPETHLLLQEWMSQGGRFVTPEELEPEAVTDNEDLLYTKRFFDHYQVHYFVNSSKDRKHARVYIKGKQLDSYSGKLLPFYGEYEFEPWGSLMLIEDGSEEIQIEPERQDFVRLEGEWQVVKPVQNILTLDKCDYYFDGELQEKNGYVLNICERANVLAREVEILQNFYVPINAIPEILWLVCETPELFRIQVNGTEVEKKEEGWVIDKSFRKINITEYLKVGENIISFTCRFKQDQVVYDCLKKAEYFETEKNRLAYDMEIEAVYLMGDFSVKTDGMWEQIEKNAVRYSGDFVLDIPEKKIVLRNMEQQGYPFFCGTLCLEGEIDIQGENPVLVLDSKGISTVAVEINEKEKVLMTENQLPLKEFGVKGRTKVKLSVTNNLRNMLGPHHLADGESYSVSPASFYKETCIWNCNDRKEWMEGYCFAEFSIE